MWVFVYKVNGVCLCVYLKIKMKNVFFLVMLEEEIDDIMIMGDIDIDLFFFLLCWGKFSLMVYKDLVKSCYD